MADKNYKLHFNMTDGTIQEVQFSVPSGETPKKGVDYFTEADKEEFLNGVEAVRYVEQTLTEEQKTQARENIGVLEPLIGSTDDIIPAQVSEALREGRNITVSYTDPIFGIIYFTSFTEVPALNAIVSSGVQEYNGDNGISVMRFSLVGVADGETWNFTYGVLANYDDIPTKTSDLTNDSGFITTVTADNSLNENSENPVQNKVVTSHIKTLSNQTENLQYGLASSSSNALKWDGNLENRQYIIVSNEDGQRIILMHMSSNVPDIIDGCKATISFKKLLTNNSPLAVISGVCTYHTDTNGFDAFILDDNSTLNLLPIDNFVIILNEDMPEMSLSKGIYFAVVQSYIDEKWINDCYPISFNLDGVSFAEDISETVNAALAQAKESGEFNGESPTITLSNFSDSIGSGVNIEVTNPGESGQTYPVYNGRDGTSAFARVTKSGNVTTITTQDATGTRTVEVYDGEDGKSGVYILSDGETINDVPDDINVVIDPNGDENCATGAGAPIYSMDSNNPILNGVATTKKVPLHTYGFIRADGTISTVENAMRTDYVAITSRMSSIYAKVNMSSGGYALAFFDGDKNLLPDISVLGTGELPQIVNVSLNESYDNAKFFVVGYYDANKEYIHYDCTINYSANASGTDDYGLNILVFGDSISTSANISVDENDCTTQYILKTNSYQNASGQSIVFNTWPNLLPNVLGCKDIRNYAYSGASYKDQERANGLEFQNLSYQIQVALNDVSNPNNVFPSVNYSPDIVIFALGTNDGSPNDTPESALSKIVLSEDGYSIDVDSTLASLDKGKFCESAMWAFLTVKKAFPMALGFCVLPIQRANSETNTQELHDYLSKMARRYGFIIIDGAYDTGIVRDLEVYHGLGTMLKDGLHPNEKGQNLLCRAILTAIRRYYLPFAGMN